MTHHLKSDQEWLEEFKIDVGLEILCARIDAGMTQKKLAERIVTKQPGIARAERGRVLPTLELLRRIGLATKHDLIVKLVPRVAKSDTVTFESTWQLV